MDGWMDGWIDEWMDGWIVKKEKKNFQKDCSFCVKKC